MTSIKSPKNPEKFRRKFAALVKIWGIFESTQRISGNKYETSREN